MLSYCVSPVNHDLYEQLKSWNQFIEYALVKIVSYKDVWYEKLAFYKSVRADFSIVN
jgi:hypothetical protein